ncbi:MAG TPA: MazG-like family protein [Rubrivivax sp.]|nr:MazG-like family protein [Rubrivivax sp.]HRY86498.1 MazG-like family protein [Rubrivivax sp.]
MSNLSFNALRQANALRLPQFKNKRGEFAHSKPDGSDWTPAQWFQALIGEVGELAEARLAVEAGIGDEAEIGKEAADVQAYLDIFCMRALDESGPDFWQTSQQSPQRALMHVIAHIGNYANLRKKFERGDIDEVEFETGARPHLMEAAMRLSGIASRLGMEYADGPTVRMAHATGIDLAKATESKFNEVSERVGSSVALRDGVVVNDSTAEVAK